MENTELSWKTREKLKKKLEILREIDELSKKP